MIVSEEARMITIPSSDYTSETYLPGEIRIAAVIAVAMRAQVKSFRWLFNRCALEKLLPSLVVSIVVINSI